MKKTITLMTLLAVAPLWAQRASFSSESPNFNRRVRNLGMGNVGVALRGSHDSSPFYNPAGLNDLEEGEIQFLGFTAELTPNDIGLIGDVADLVDDLDQAQTQSQELDVFNAFLADNTGKYRYLRFNLDLVNYARKNFAAGVFLNERLNLTVREPALAQFEVRNTADITAYVAGATDFWDKLVQVGVTLKPTVRFSLDEADEAVTFADATKNAQGKVPLGDQFKQIYRERRFGLGVDLGLKSNLGFGEIKDSAWYKLLQPSVGVSWEDISDVAFDTAPDNQQSLNVGVAVHPDIWRLKNAFAIELRQLSEERPFLSKLHIGAETQLPWVLSARAGLSQGYVTAGLTADLWVAKLEGAIYFEEVGQSTRQEGNQRYAVRLSFNI